MYVCYYYATYTHTYKGRGDPFTSWGFLSFYLTLLCLVFVFRVLVFLSVWLSVLASLLCLSVYCCVCLYLFVSIFLPVCQAMCLSYVKLSDYLFMCVYVCRKCSCACMCGVQEVLMCVYVWCACRIVQKAHLCMCGVQEASLFKARQALITAASAYVSLTTFCICLSLWHDHCGILCMCFVCAYVVMCIHPETKRRKQSVQYSLDGAYIPHAIRPCYMPFTHLSSVICHASIHPCLCLCITS